MSFGNYSPLQGESKVPGGYRHGQLAQYTPEQIELFRNLFQHIGPESFTSRMAMGDQSQFAQMEAPAMRQFQSQLGNIASRFSQSGARRSSAFQNATSSAAQELAERLQGQRLGLQQQAVQSLFGLGSSLLSQRPYEQFITPKGRSFLEELALGLAGAGSQAAGQGAGAKLMSMMG